ncbi:MULTISPECIES: sensor histidine kinase [unclassified Leifsonia]|uniref:sensor histidine kinase n=1 Tax=unclassified Leifsonia TaxID=2663824 RepID=UPI0003749618|nr:MULTISPECIES: HAMP domain-containing sensor histidine kinase [unclassified Leifsonia]TDQ02606.1 two-component system OmpR family sensor kinase [Leifsonia sp. 115AMFTsu3.1]
MTSARDAGAPVTGPGGTGRASGRSWRIRPFRSWTLRSRVVLVVVAMLAVLGAVIGTVSVFALQNYLMQRLDGQLTSALDRGQRAADRIYGDQPTGPDVIGIVQTPGQQTGTFGVIRSGDMLLYPVILSERPAGSTPDQPVAPKRVLISTTALLSLPSDGHPRTIDLGASLGEYRVAAVELTNGDSVIIGLPLSDVNATVARLTLVIVLVTLAGLVFAFLLASVVVRLAMRPLERVADTAEQVSSLPLDRGDVALSVRVPEADTDQHTEVGKVGSALNRMLGHVASALTARQASEQKVRQFVADASHELRTPLASIRGYAELTRRAPHELPPDVTHSLGRIESEATRMTSLVEDLLLLARLDEGRELDRDPVDLSLLLVDALSDAHAAGPDHEWALDLPDEPVEVVGDAPRLHQVLMNLLANARVHTPEGTKVTAGLRVDEDAHRAVITVADDGPGIPEDMQATLFERFARGDSSRNRATGSTGLGLAIVQAVVQAHEGDVTVTSEPGRTVFTVSLPLVPAAV